MVLEYTTQYASYKLPNNDNRLIARWDANMGTSYSGSGSTVNDIGGSSLNATMSNVTYNYSTSATSPSYFEFNGTSSKMTISNSSFSFLNDAYSASTTGQPAISIYIWHRPSSDHTGTLFSADEGSGGERSFKVGVKNGNLRTASSLL